MKVGPLQMLLFYGQIRPEVDPGRAKWSKSGPFFKELLQDRKAKSSNITMILCLMTHEGRSFVIFFIYSKAKFLTRYYFFFWGGG